MFNQVEYNKNHKEQMRLNIKRYRQRKSHIYKLYNAGQLISKSDINKKYISKPQLIHIIKDLQQQEHQHYQSIQQSLNQNHHLLQQLIKNQKHNHTPLARPTYPSKPNYPTPPSIPYSDSLPSDYIPQVTKTYPHTTNSNSNNTNSIDTKRQLALFKGRNYVSNTGKFVITEYNNPKEMTVKKAHRLLNYLVKSNTKGNYASFSNAQWTIIISYLNEIRHRTHITDQEWYRLIHSRTILNHKRKTISQSSVQQGIYKEMHGYSNSDME